MKKKYILIATLLMSFPASAQMIDTIGALGIQGELGAEGYRGVARMQNALENLNFQQDMTTLLFSVQTNFMGRYDNLSKDIVNFDGFQGIDWNIGSESAGTFFLEFNHLDIATCMSCKNREWGYRNIDINSGGDCHGDDKVKMTF